MLILNPQRVELGAATLDRVTAVAIDRDTVAPVERWGPAGPWCPLVDSAKRRVSVTLRQEPGPVFDAGPPLGSLAELRITVAPASGSRERRRIRCACVVTAVRYEQPTTRPPLRTIELIAVSAGATPGATDPVTVEEVNP